MTRRSIMASLAVVVAVVASGASLAEDKIKLPAEGTGHISGNGLSITNTQNYLGNGHDRPVAINATASGTASIGVEATNSGNGWAGYFELIGPAPGSSSVAVAGVDSGGSTTTIGQYGLAGSFNITNIKNSSDALSAKTVGPGAAGFFDIDTANGADNSIDDFRVPTANGADTPAIWAQNDDAGFGFLGQAGYFAITNVNNNSDVIYATTPAQLGTAVHGAVGPALTGISQFIGGTKAVYGDDFTTGGEGMAVAGSSKAGFSANFFGGSDGGGSCFYKGGAGWTCTSDRNLKEHFEDVDLDAVLVKLDAMPVFYYQMKGSKLPLRYLGPTAQDFKAAFDLGEDDTHINTANAQGVAIAAAKGLYQKIKADEAIIAAQGQKITALEKALGESLALNERVAKLEATLVRGGGVQKQASLLVK